MDGTDKDQNPTAEAEETTKADPTADAASGDAGAGDEAAQETAAQDTQEKAETAAAETPAKADQTAAVTEAKAEKPAEDKDKPAEDKAKPTDDKAAEHAKQVEKLTAKVTKAETRLRNEMAENAAYKAGIRPDRVDKAVKLAGISGIDLSADDAKEKFEAALQAVADDMPEFTAPPAGTGSVGAFARKKDVKEDAFSRGLRGEKR